MGETKLTFKRYEKKYLLTGEQYDSLFARLEPYIEPDEYPQSTVCSVYYDSEDYRLIRHSLDKPVYKEKLRVRGYGVTGPEDPVFVELKKKFKGIVYKRRVTMPAARAAAWLAGEGEPTEDGQMIREIQWFVDQNRPEPRVLIACDRSAWRSREDPELRITFDRNIRWRRNELELWRGSEGETLLDDDSVLMELKIPGAAPLWLARMLSELSLFPTSFSKYGTCYRDCILREILDGVMSHV
ncbi:MAG: polyphosphate polymerase domain-containing protein [Oscillospiraceae bacterium]|nr:polyphosphate polymerase domain-containing protein [Oscillospiraceae bacterium]